jgi:tRNA threonylcarbamoyladenosine biosynthesis protein TsaB
MAMVSGMQASYTGRNLQFCPLLDARRMEVYTLVANAHSEVVATERAYIIADPVFDFVPKEVETVYFGSGLLKCKEMLPPGSIADTSYVPSAEHLHILAFRQFSMKNFADVAYYEPDYGKEFYTPAKK